jgi:hypothetical protein
MPSAKKGRAARKVTDSAEGKPKTKRRLKTLEATAALKAEVYRRCEPVLDRMPDYKGQYTAELGEALAELVAEGAVLRDIASLEGMPKLHVMLRWIGEAGHPFAALYAAAKLVRVPALEELSLETALKPNIQVLKTRRQVLDKFNGVVTLKEEREVDNVQRSELVMKAIGWTLGHTMPKKHGRNPEDEKPNDQLNSLFAALMKGPAGES